MINVGCLLPLKKMECLEVALAPLNKNRFQKILKGLHYKQLFKIKDFNQSNYQNIIV